MCAQGSECLALGVSWGLGSEKPCCLLYVQTLLRCEERATMQQLIGLHILRYRNGSLMRKKLQFVAVFAKYWKR